MFFLFFIVFFILTPAWWCVNIQQETKTLQVDLNLCLACLSSHLCTVSRHVAFLQSQVLFVSLKPFAVFEFGFGSIAEINRLCCYLFFESRPMGAHASCDHVPALYLNKR